MDSQSMGGANWRSCLSPSNVCMAMASKLDAFDIKSCSVVCITQRQDPRTLKGRCTPSNTATCSILYDAKEHHSQ